MSVFCTHQHRHRGAELRQGHECPCTCTGLPAAGCAQCADAPLLFLVFLAHVSSIRGANAAAAPQMSDSLAMLQALPITCGLLECNQAAEEPSSSVLLFAKLRLKQHHLCAYTEGWEQVPASHLPEDYEMETKRNRANQEDDLKLLFCFYLLLPPHVCFWA